MFTLNTLIGNYGIVGKKVRQKCPWDGCCIVVHTSHNKDDQDRVWRNIIMFLRKNKNSSSIAPQAGAVLCCWVLLRSWLIVSNWSPYIFCRVTFNGMAVVIKRSSKRSAEVENSLDFIKNPFLIIQNILDLEIHVGTFVITSKVRHSF